MKELFGLFLEINTLHMKNFLSFLEKNADGSKIALNPLFDL